MMDRINSVATARKETTRPATHKKVKNIRCHSSLRVSVLGHLRKEMPETSVEEKEPHVYLKLHAGQKTRIGGMIAQQK